MRQYEIWWADLPAPVGRRPVLLLTRSSAYAYLNKAIVAEITTTIRGIPQEVPVGEPEGLVVPSVVNFDNIHVVAKRLLASRVGVLPAAREREVKRALGYALDWAELKSL
jgi:mRNA interferase MazF